MKNIIVSNIVRSDLYQQYCNHIYWNNLSPRANTDFHTGDIVFCKIDEVLHFFEKLRLTRKKIILVTGEGDNPCDDFLQQFLPKNVVRWFATNVTHPHPKVTALPLGLGGINDLVTLNVKKIAASNNIVRDRWLYVNFRPMTNRAVRQKIYDNFQQLARHQSWITFELSRQHGDNDHFLTQLQSHHFVLAPPGNGIDTHRLWEALVAGAYPVAFRSRALEPFESLPILFIDHDRELTLDFLKVKLPFLEEKKKNLEMLSMSYWMQKIKEAQSNCHDQANLSWNEWLQESLRYGVKMIQRRVHEYF